MADRPLQFGPRKDFPVRRLIEKLILGNMVFAGGLFLIGIAVETFEGFTSGFPEGIVGDIRSDFEEVVQMLLRNPPILVFFLMFGTLLGVAWHWIARRLETREFKKRFGILTKSCTSLKGDVKSSHS